MASILSAVLVAIVVCATVSAQHESTAEFEALKAVSDSNLDFSNSLFKVLSSKEGNLIFSPASIQTILALTSLGARGPTAQQMTTGLHLPEDKETTKAGFRHLTNAWHLSPIVTLKVANRIFTDEHYPLNEDFSLTARDDFHSGTQQVDYVTKPDEARLAVNQWAKENTERKIVDLLPTGSVTSSTTVILANAVYFKGNWANKFHTGQTNPMPFYVSADVTKQVPMMHLKVSAGQFGYKDSELLNAEILEMPYVGKKISLVIILPKERHGLSEVEAKLTQVKFSNISSSVRMVRPEVRLSLPKFKLEEAVDLKETLEQMGMARMFEDGADFSGLASGPIKVSKVAHKAFIEVNEEGTEAAAATAVIGVMRSGPRQLPEVVFNVNHPFIFILANTESANTSHGHHKERTILFMGRCANP